MNTDDYTVLIKADIEDGESRMCLWVNSANGLKFSFAKGDMDYDECILNLCAVAPSLARVDADLAEMYDGDLAHSPKESDLGVIRSFRRWLRSHNLTLRSDGDYFEYLSD